MCDIQNLPIDCEIMNLSICAKMKCIFSRPVFNYYTVPIINLK